MKYSQAAPGRVFILRLEDGEVLHQEVEAFAREQGITAASLIAVGGADRGSRLVVGPRTSRGPKPNPMYHELPDAHEIAGVGTIFCDETGTPLLHMHTACGREESTITGCVRDGVKTWQVLEVIIHELTGTSAHRRFDPALGFKLLDPG